MIYDDRLRAFLLNNAVLAKTVRSLGKEFGADNFDLRNELRNDPLIKNAIAQIPIDLRRTGMKMSAYFEIFYILENDIRTLIISTLSEKYGENWWDNYVPLQVKESAQKNKRREFDAGVSIRSSRDIDYITFGELGEIIKINLDEFPFIKSKTGIEKVMSSLNLLRGTIAHCGILTTMRLFV